MYNTPVNQLENFVASFDFMFQEGAIFTKEEIEKIKVNIEYANRLLNDPCLNERR